MSFTRREVVSTMAAGAAMAAAGSAIAEATAGEKSKPAAAAGALPTPLAAGQHEVRPLAFDPRKLKGISEAMIVSHHDNNYAGAVKNLNKVEGELATINKDTPGFVVTGLRERELTFTNSLILHEKYFGNLGGGGGAASGTIEKLLAKSFGSLARWEELFRATAMSLGGGSGWTLLDFNFHTGDVRTYWSGGHSQSVAFGYPLLVLDMYEHAYAIDYGSAHAKYIDAFFQNIDWEEVNNRTEHALKAYRVLPR
jgi:Fe-Mn family superoxide dismutase